MKLALDVWYELWERTGSEGGTDLDRRPGQEDEYYPWHEDYLVWLGSKEAPDDGR